MGTQQSKRVQHRQVIALRPSARRFGNAYYTINELRAAKYPNNNTHLNIGLVGFEGDGKSSIINSFYDAMEPNQLYFPSSRAPVFRRSIGPVTKTMQVYEIKSLDGIKEPCIFMYDIPGLRVGMMNEQFVNHLTMYVRGMVRVGDNPWICNEYQHRESHERRIHVCFLAIRADRVGPSWDGRELDLLRRCYQVIRGEGTRHVFQLDMYLGSCICRYPCVYCPHPYGCGVPSYPHW